MADTLPTPKEALEAVRKATSTLRQVTEARPFEAIDRTVPIPASNEPLPFTRRVFHPQEGHPLIKVVNDGPLKALGQPVLVDYKKSSGIAATVRLHFPEPFFDSTLATKQFGTPKGRAIAILTRVTEAGEPRWVISRNYIVVAKVRSRIGDEEYATVVLNARHADAPTIEQDWEAVSDSIATKKSFRRPGWADEMIPPKPARRSDF